MTNLQIDRALALAIGWKPEQITDINGWSILVSPVYSGLSDNNRMRYFSHLDPAVIWPIAERFNVFPGRHPTSGYWLAAFPYNGKWIEGIHPNPATAVALAVIEANPYGVPTK